MTHRIMSPDGIAIRYEVDGSGAPSLVFVHGWSCDRTFWAAQMRAFASGHRVVAIDLAGHGESGVGRESWISNGAPVLERLSAVSVPIVAINPDYRPTDEASLRRHGVRPVLMSGVGHFLMMEDPTSSTVC